VASEQAYVVRDARPEALEALGRLMVDVYSSLEGFPGPAEQPRYYEMLAHIDWLAQKPETRLLVAAAPDRLLGGVVYFSDMAGYGSGGAATREQDASGFRLLAVDPVARGLGVAKALVEDCIALAREKEHRRVIIHTTKAMKVAWGMYERWGFERYPELDFQQEELQVFGFRLEL
jgi:GNAT superfamily N-acetyltransferase